MPTKIIITELNTPSQTALQTFGQQIFNDLKTHLNSQTEAKSEENLHE